MSHCGTTLGKAHTTHAWSARLATLGLSTDTLRSGCGDDASMQHAVKVQPFRNNVKKQLTYSGSLDEECFANPGRQRWLAFGRLAYYNTDGQPPGNNHETSFVLLKEF